MNNPLVSIIIPTFNRAHLIGETLDSVLAQTYENWECIIVDDGSTDNTAEVVNGYIQKDSRFQFYHRPIEKINGASSCRNFGLSLSKGVFVIFLDSDDLLLEYCLANRILKVSEKSDLNFWVFPMFVESENQERTIKEIPFSKSYLIDFLSYKIHWGIMCTLWEANFLKKIKGFNELYPRLNDPEIHIRAMLESKNRFFIFNDALADSVYKVTLLRDRCEFSKIYSTSLLLFIPDITNKLREHKLLQERKHLKAYLRDYFVGFFRYNSRKRNFSVLNIFYAFRIINIVTYYKLHINYCLFLVFNYLTRKTRNKLDNQVTNL